MGHSYAALYYHVVFSTKDRRPEISTDLRSRLCDYIGGIVKGENGTLLAAGGVADHLHLLAAFHGTTSVADMMRQIKTNSSKWIHETFPANAGFAWQSGYGAFTVSQSNQDQVRAYIENQETHHARVTFQEEFLSFLKRHNLPYDERYVWG